jgi:hypothetical protein
MTAPNIVYNSQNPKSVLMQAKESEKERGKLWVYFSNGSDMLTNILINEQLMKLCFSSPPTFRCSIFILQVSLLLNFVNRQRLWGYISLAFSSISFPLFPNATFNLTKENHIAANERSEIKCISSEMKWNTWEICNFHSNGFQRFNLNLLLNFIFPVPHITFSLRFFS